MGKCPLSAATAALLRRPRGGKYGRRRRMERQSGLNALKSQAELQLSTSCDVTKQACHLPIVLRKRALVWTTTGRIGSRCFFATPVASGLSSQRSIGLRTDGIKMPHAWVRTERDELVGLEEVGRRKLEPKTTCKLIPPRRLSLWETCQPMRWSQLTCLHRNLRQKLRMRPGTHH